MRFRGSCAPAPLIHHTMASPVRRAGKEPAIMLAYLTDEQCPSCEPGSLDATLAASDLDQGERTRAAYEAALQLDAERWWVPARLRQPTMRQCEVPA
jgi:anti-sigma factor ChrR (cupin superfamily)